MITFDLFQVLHKHSEHDTILHFYVIYLAEKIEN